MRRLGRFARSAGLCLLAATGVAGAGAETLWGEFRGPTGQGHSTARGVPLEWGPGRSIRWRTEIPGRAWSSPIVAGGRIYLTDARSLDPQEPASGVSLRLLSLNATTGRVLWDTEIFRHADVQSLRKHDKNSHASPTPVYEPGRIYAHFGHLGTACLDERGRVLWKTTEHAYQPVHGNGGSPVLVGDLLIFNADGAQDPSVIALEKQTGRLRWRSRRPESAAPNKFSFCTPLVIQVAGRTLLITPGSGLVQALDPSDGSEVWRVRYGQGYSVVPRPVFAHGLVFVTSGYNQASLYAIRPDGRGDVTDTHVAWSSNRRVPKNPSLLVVGDELYMLDDAGMLSCMDAKTGALHYQERALGASSASLLYADGRVYGVDETGKAIVVRPGKTFQLLATNDLQERTLASMAVCDSNLLLRTETALYRIGGN